eukprot:TRINITY_DN44125_c0_g1_i4.p2 TRINITY_DN44125_c0_g1~~TRINITY_DN44125_c0_g1_i4.p2  ORF type:complete len:167 (-),score=31.24 TRINITY_DN44125_c0_g1_i4:247-747(-)
MRPMLQAAPTTPSSSLGTVRSAESSFGESHWDGGLQDEAVRRSARLAKVEQAKQKSRSRAKDPLSEAQVQLHDDLNSQQRRLQSLQSCLSVASSQPAASGLSRKSRSEVSSAKSRKGRSEVSSPKSRKSRSEVSSPPRGEVRLEEATVSGWPPPEGVPESEDALRS